MTPDPPPIPPGAWLPRLEAARRLGVTERTLQRRMKQGLVMARHDEHNRVQVYVPDTPGARHDSGHDMAMTPNPLRAAEAIVAGMHGIINAQRDDFLARTTEQEGIIRQQAEEIGALREKLQQAHVNQQHVIDEINAALARRNAALAAQATPWWRVLWARLSGRET